MLSLLIELQRLKRLERTGWLLRGMPSGTESVAAHSFGVALSAMFLVDELVSKGIRVDLGRVLRMALLHDWAEARIGDIPRTAIAYFGADARKGAESAAFADMTRGFNDGKSYQDLYQEYEQKQTLEARLVKAADVIDLLVQTLALERTGARGLDEFWEVARNPDFQLDAPADQLVAGILESLLEERRKLTTDAL